MNNSKGQQKIVVSLLDVICIIDFHASRELLDTCKCPVQMQLSVVEDSVDRKPAEITQRRASGAPTSARCLSTARKIARGHVSSATLIPLAGQTAFQCVSVSVQLSTNQSSPVNRCKLCTSGQFSKKILHVLSAKCKSYPSNYSRSMV